jgi:hypothetical protein
VAGASGLGLGKLLTSQPTGPEPDGDELAGGGLSIAAGDLLRAIKANDQAGVEAALHASYMACQSQDSAAPAAPTPKPMGA